MRFLHIVFRGRTTSPWHVGKRQFGDFHYTRTDLLWGRGVRGAVLRYLWRTCCPKSDAAERAEFNPDADCLKCGDAEDCPFFQLRGSNDGEFKDRPKLILTNLRFENVRRTGRLAIVPRSDARLAVVRGKGPVIIEYIPEGVKFEFEAVLMGRGVDFRDALRSSVEASLRFFGWGGFCNEGFGRGRLESVEERGYERFIRSMDAVASKIEEHVRDEGRATFRVEPVLILEREGGVYTSPLEEGFREKLTNCLNERFWQFLGRNIYVPVRDVSGRARSLRIRAWSRKAGGEFPKGGFRGVGGELTLHLETENFEHDHAMALAVAKYGIGRFKNMGFGSLIPRLT